MGSEGGSRKCVSCGREIPMDANVCQYCGHDYRVQVGPAVPKEKSALSLIAGILILISGIVGLAMGGILMVAAAAVSEGTEELGDWGLGDIGAAGDWLTDALLVCGAIVIIISLIVVLGGVFGIMRKHWGFVIVGGVLGLLFTWPLYFVGGICALVGLILAAVSKKDFD